MLESLRGQLEFFVSFQRKSKPLDWPYPFVSIEDFVLRHGIVFERSREQPPIPPIPKACFYQSYVLSQRIRRWIYCEGYALTSHSLGIAVHHAWVVRDDDPTQAVDLAWEDGTRDDTTYLGIPFRPDFVRSTYKASGRRRLYNVLDTPWVNYPLLTGETRIEDVIWTNDHENKNDNKARPLHSLRRHKKESQARTRSVEVQNANPRDDLARLA
jgi:hypothetical protein